MYRLVVSVAILLLLLVTPLWAQGGRTYTYRFENERFELKFIELRVAGDGNGELHYKKRDDDEETELSFVLLPATLQRMQSLYDAVHFLDTLDSYQANANLPNLGKVTLALKDGEKGRETSFNYTDNKSVQKLVELFRAIELQQRRIADLKLARQFTPLDLPRQLKSLEEDLKREKIAEPTQMVPILSDIAVDDSLPLIARNAAQKLANNIKRNGHS